MLRTSRAWHLHVDTLSLNVAKAASAVVTMKGEIFTLQFGHTATMFLARSLSVIAIALVGALILSACNPRAAESGTLDVTIVSVSPDPATAGDAVITLRIRDAEGNPVEGATIEVEGTMTHAGMQPVIVTTEALGEGKYATQDFRFTMGGDWVIIVRATLADGSTAEQRVNLKGVQGEMKLDMKSDKAKEGN